PAGGGAARVLRGGGAARGARRDHRAARRLPDLRERVRHRPLRGGRRPSRVHRGGPLPLDSERGGDRGVARAALVGIPHPGELAGAEHTWVVCGRDHAAAVREALPTLPPAHLVVEPAARNTAPAIGLAAVEVSREDPSATLVVLPSDHYIAQPEAFREALRTA